MSASHEAVDEIIVLVDIDDPMTYDSEFLNRIQYGNFVKTSSEFTIDNREVIRSNADDDELTNSKFYIEIYTDRLADFVRAVLYSQDWQRALIFREERVIGTDPEELLEGSPTELSDIELTYHYYELKTVARMPIDENEIDDEEEEDDDDTEDEEEATVKLSAELDKFPSLFLPESKTLH